MPTVSIYEAEVRPALGEALKKFRPNADMKAAFDDLCFDFGLELDEVTSEYEMFRKERGNRSLLLFKYLSILV